MARIKFVINERRLAYEGAVEQFAKDKALGKIGAVAEQEAAKKRTKPGKKMGKRTIAQGKSRGSRQTKSGSRQEAAKETTKQDKPTIKAASAVRARGRSRRTKSIRGVVPAAPAPDATVNVAP